MWGGLAVGVVYAAVMFPLALEPPLGHYVRSGLALLGVSLAGRGQPATRAAVVKVAHLVPALFGARGTVGGAERYVLELARHMAVRVPTTLVTFGDRDATSIRWRADDPRRRDAAVRSGPARQPDRVGGRS